MGVRQAAKYLIYRAPILGRLMAPRYRYWVNPAQLAALVELIDATRDERGAIAEIGIGNGYTSAFILEHLRTTNDPRPLLLFDTFSGFTPASVAAEPDSGHPRFAEFRHGSAKVLARNLRRAGYTNFRIHAGDAAEFDWQSIAQIGAALLDIDLYAPTKACLSAIYPRLTRHGGIVLDDCEEGPWQGALRAYREFTAEHGLPLHRIGSKGGLVRYPE